jgi:hypothetical protein
MAVARQGQLQFPEAIEYVLMSWLHFFNGFYKPKRYQNSTLWVLLSQIISFEFSFARNGTNGSFGPFFG